MNDFKFCPYCGHTLENDLDTNKNPFILPKEPAQPLSVMYGVTVGNPNITWSSTEHSPKDKP